MKTYVFLVVALMLAVSCRKDDADSVQKIDQIVEVYMKNNLGADLLNRKVPGAYQEILLKDLGGIRDQISIGTATVKKDADTASYIQYIAGAKRNLVDSISPQLKNYRSDILLEMRKTAADSAELDTMTVFYEWTPETFRVKKIDFNKKQVFQKTGDEPNRFTIVK